MKIRQTLIVSMLTLFTAAGAFAQSSVWTTTLGQQLAQNIESESRSMKARAIQQAHYFAVYGKEADLDAAVPVLVGIYKNDPEAQMRLAAVAALHAIGNNAGMQAVRAALAGQTDQRVQMVSIAALREHFGVATFSDSKEIATMARAILDARRDGEQAVTAN